MRHTSWSGERFVPVLALVLWWAAPAGAQDAAVRAAVDASNRKFVAAVAKADAAALGGLYTLEATALPPNSEPVKGRANISGMWKSVLDTGVSAVELVTVDLESTGDMAAEVGTYVLKARDGTVADRGKYVVVWKKQGGQWLIHKDIWNTSLPAPAQP